MALQLEPKTQAVLELLQSQAEARHMHLADYLRLYADAGEVAADNGPLSTEQLEHLFDELSADPLALPTLPAGFSRKDIYLDHD